MSKNIVYNFCDSGNVWRSSKDMQQGATAHGKVQELG